MKMCVSQHRRSFKHDAILASVFEKKEESLVWSLGARTKPGKRNLVWKGCSRQKWWFSISLANICQTSLMEYWLHEKSPNTEFFWSVFSCIPTNYGDLRRKFPYSVRETLKSILASWLTFFLTVFVVLL